MQFWAKLSTCTLHSQETGPNLPSPQPGFPRVQGGMLVTLSDFMCSISETAPMWQNEGMIGSHVFIFSTKPCHCSTRANFQAPRTDISVPRPGPLESVTTTVRSGNWRLPSFTHTESLRLNAYQVPETESASAVCQWYLSVRMAARLAGFSLVVL